MRRVVSIMLLSIILSVLTTIQAQNVGFRISGRKVLDGNGNEFIMRGINYPHAWYKQNTNAAIPAIAATGANCVRVVLSNGKHGENWGKNTSTEIQTIISLCKTNKLIAILEVHDCTGYPEKQGAQPLSTATDYWIEMKNVLIGQEDFVIINIANEPIGNNNANPEVVNTMWVNDHKAAIVALRNAGLKHLLMVDASNWGQDWSGTTRTRASEVLNADPDGNTIISIHMYEEYSTASKITTYLNSFVSNNLPLCVGEFAADHANRGTVDEQTIMSKCKELGIGYIGWSWSGNSSDLTSLDIVRNFNAGSLTTWGDILINGANGLKETSQICSIFEQNQQNQSPEVTIISLPDTAIFDAPASVLISATASDPDGQITRCEFFSADTKIGECFGHSYTFNWENVAAGTYTITVVVTDNSGAVTPSDPVIVIVNEPVHIQSVRVSAQRSITAQAEIFDLHGRLLYRTSLQEVITKLSKLPTRTAVIRITDKNRVLMHGKLLHTR